MQIPGRLHITWRTPAVLGDLKAGCKDVLSMHYFIMAPFKMRDKSLYDSLIVDDYFMKAEAEPA